MQHQNLRTGFGACSILHKSYVKIDLTRGSCTKPTSLIFGGASFIGICIKSEIPINDAPPNIRDVGVA
ncbi:unnamed protein product [Brachionus calyciflorus]|uniref:Uncharacterized protein n=1 Tax=Brachionus calyciflorus TaxID=104777 RepID=A0A814MYG8_9BILA|nr:unnamed protein product [Brachionus calyciflorus]